MPETVTPESSSESSVISRTVFVIIVSAMDFGRYPEFSGGVTMNESSNPCGTTSILYCPCWFV